MLRSEEELNPTAHAPEPAGAPREPAAPEAREIPTELPDVMACEGIHPETPRVPFTPGWNLVGVVDRLGEGVSEMESGQIVTAIADQRRGCGVRLPAAR